MDRSNARPSGPQTPSTTDRDVLQDYLDEVVHLPVLAPDEQTRLFERMEEAESTLRTNIAAIPETSRLLLEKWRARQEQGLVTGALSKWHRDGSQRDCNALIDAAMARVEGALAVVERARGRAGSRSRTVDVSALVECVEEAEIALPVLLEVLETLETTVPRGRNRADKKVLRVALEARAQLTDSKNLFISHNLRLVIRCAKNYRNQGVPFLDLIQEGNVGLIRAVEKFDHRRGYKFSTYAVWWIEQSLVRSIATDSRMVRIPSPVLDQRRKLKQIEGSARAAQAGEPTTMDLIDGLGLDAGAADDLRRSLSSEISTQTPIGGTDALVLEETLDGDDGEEVVDALDQSALARCMREIIPSLGEREQLVIEARFGLSGQTPRTLADIGRELGVSRERVRQIEIQALRELSQNEQAQSIAAELGRI